MKRSLFLLLLAVCFATGANATVYYVDSAQANNTGAGTSWATAKKDIQNAIDLANVNGDEVWVKAGTYLPTINPITMPNGIASSNNRDKTLYLASKDIKLYGGFSGIETASNQRNPTLNVTILSGDLDGSAGTDDAYHVLLTLRCTPTCVVDGFTITGGRANASDHVYVVPYGNSIYRNRGGGMANYSSSPTINNCIFISNISSNSPRNGGGLYIRDGADAIITNCAFTGNIGSGASIESSHSVVRNCVFSTNTNGGMYVNGNNETNNCVFSNNTGSYGGGISNNSTIDTVSIAGCVFFNNIAISGGGVYSIGGDFNIRNCTFYSNSVTGTAGSRGGAIYFHPRTTGGLSNCILWGNTTPDNTANPNREEVFRLLNSSSLTISHSIIRDYINSADNNYTSGAGIRSVAPRFVNEADPDGADNIWGTADDGLTLLSCSPAINTGDPASTTPTTDLLGNNRVGAYDLGAYESQGTAATGLAIDRTSATTTVDSGYGQGFGTCGAVIADVASAGARPVAGSVTATVYRQLGPPTTSNGQPYVRRHYDIHPATNPDSATANLTLYFAQGDFTTYNSNNPTYPPLPASSTDSAGIANLRITQQHGTSATGLPGSYTGWAGAGPANVLITPTSVIWNTTLLRWEVSFPVTGFSGFFAHSTLNNTALPVKLLSFTAQVAGTANAISWQVAGQDAGTTYRIERSATGSEFVTIGAVAAGNKNEYSFFDDEAPTAVTYYRLRIISENGEHSYSTTVLVRHRMAGTNGVTLYPVPVTSLLNLQNTDAALEGSIAIVQDIQGKEILRFTMRNEISVDATNWPAGLYVLRLASGNITRFTKH
jgi:hypothetical protein